MLVNTSVQNFFGIDLMRGFVAEEGGIVSHCVGGAPQVWQNSDGSPSLGNLLDAVNPKKRLDIQPKLPTHGSKRKEDAVFSVLGDKYDMTFAGDASFTHPLMLPAPGNLTAKDLGYGVTFMGVIRNVLGAASVRPSRRYYYY